MTSIVALSNSRINAFEEALYERGLKGARAARNALVPDARGSARGSIWLHERFAYGGIAMVRVNLRLDVCPRDSEFANAATPANIETTATAFMSILSPKSTIC